MKKILGGLLLAMLGLSTTFASLSYKEQQQVKKVHTMLSEYGEQLDAVFMERDYIYNELKAQREGLLMYIEQALECQGEACLAYSYDMIKEELIDYLEVYIEMKKSVEILSNMDMETYSEAQNAMLRLQKHMMKIVTAGYDLDRPIHEKGVVNLDLAAYMPFVGSIKADISIDADSKYDLPAALVDSNQMIEGSLTIDPPTEDPQTISADGTIHVKMIGDKMYLSLDEIDISGLENTGDPSTQMIATMQALLGDAYLEIPFSPNMTQLGLSSFNGAGMRNAIYSDTVSKPMVDFYHQENPFTYYGVPSHAICDSLANLGSDSYAIAECHKRVDEIIVHTEGKGIIVLTKESGGYNLSIDDKYAPESNIEEFLLRKPMLTRNTDKLQSINIPLSENYDDRLKYENKKLTVDYADEEGSIQIEADINKESIIGAGSIQVDDVVVTMALDYQKGLIEKINFRMNATQDGVELFSFAMDAEGSIEYISEFEMMAPENIITMEELQSEMMNTMPLQPETVIEEVQFKIEE